MENNHEVTNEELARMIARGFEGTPTKQEMNTRFDKVEERLDRIENILISDHQKRIEKLEDQVKELRDALAMK